MKKGLDRLDAEIAEWVLTRKQPDPEELSELLDYEEEDGDDPSVAAVWYSDGSSKVRTCRNRRRGLFTGVTQARIRFDVCGTCGGKMVLAPPTEDVHQYKK